MADAAWHVLTRESRARTGEFLLDETVLRAAGVTDFGHYAVDPEQELVTDLFV
jgi:citronellol/citronellal dehydrogenase